MTAPGSPELGSTQLTPQFANPQLPTFESGSQTGWFRHLVEFEIDSSIALEEIPAEEADHSAGEIAVSLLLSRIPVLLQVPGMQADVPIRDFVPEFGSQFHARIDTEPSPAADLAQVLIDSMMMEPPPQEEQPVQPPQRQSMDGPVPVPQPSPSEPPTNVEPGEPAAAIRPEPPPPLFVQELNPQKPETPPHPPSLAPPAPSPHPPQESAATPASTPPHSRNVDSVPGPFHQAVMTTENPPAQQVAFALDISSDPQEQPLHASTPASQSSPLPAARPRSSEPPSSRELTAKAPSVAAEPAAGTAAPELGETSTATGGGSQQEASADPRAVRPDHPPLPRAAASQQPNQFVLAAQPDTAAPSSLQAAPAMRSQVTQTSEHAQAPLPLEPGSVHGPVSSIRIRLAGDTAQPVDVNLAGRGAGIRVSVHSGDLQLNDRLRGQVADLVAGMERGGFRAAVAADNSSSMSSSHEFSHNQQARDGSPGQHAQQQSRQQQHADDAFPNFTHQQRRNSPGSTWAGMWETQFQDTQFTN